MVKLNVLRHIMEGPAEGNGAGPTHGPGFSSKDGGVIAVVTKGPNFALFAGVRQNGNLRRSPQVTHRLRSIRLFPFSRRLLSSPRLPPHQALFFAGARDDQTRGFVGKGGPGLD